MEVIKKWKEIWEAAIVQIYYLLMRQNIAK